MTSSRIVRGTKGRVFIYICAVLFIIGIIACYNNTKTQLDDVMKTHELCRQQQENLSTQLQVIFDYKQRLEKSLKSEKTEHQQIKDDLEVKLNEERNRYEKNNKEESMRFTTLQQHYNILQTEHNDLKDECSKIQHDQLKEINQLQYKLKEVQEHLKRSESDKIKTLDHLKIKNSQLQEAYDKLQSEVKATKDTNQNVYKDKEPELYVQRVELRPTISFSKQVRISNDLYRVIDGTNVGESQVNIPNYPENIVNSFHNNSNDQQNVLPVPVDGNMFMLQKSSTASSMNREKMGPLPLLLPAVTPETVKKKTSDAPKYVQNVMPMPHQKIPDGVVPVPVLDSYDRAKDLEPAVGMDKDSIDILNNRYRAKLAEETAQKIAVDPVIAGDVQKDNNNNEKENSANEVFDFPGGNDNVIEEANVDGKSVDKDKLHIDVLAVGEDAQEKEDDGQMNDPNEDDDADDILNHIKDIAERN